MCPDSPEDHLIDSYLNEEPWAIRKIEEHIRKALAPFRRELGLDFEDVFSDAQLEVLMALRKKRIVDSSKLISYIKETVRHTAIDYLRYRRAKPVVDVDPEQLVSKEDSPDEAFERKERITRGFRLVRLLSDECRRLWRLRLVEGLADKEIARVLGISHENVRQKFFKCRKDASELGGELAD